jgi:hypothetical protein
MWFTDWSMYGPIAVQPSRLVGITMLVNNYYNGSPSGVTPSAAAWFVTKSGGGGSLDATHAAASTFTLDVGVGIAGIASASAAGFTSALKIGGTGAWGVASRFTNAVELLDYDTIGLKFTSPYTASTPVAIAVAAGAGPVVVGALAPPGGNSAELFAVPHAGTKDPLVRFGTTQNSPFTVYYQTSTAIFKTGMANTANQFMTGTAQGDFFMQPATAAKKIHIGGAASVIAVTQDSKLGCFQVTPVVQYATAGTLTGFTAGTTTPVLDGSTFTGNTGATAYTIGDIVRCLKLYGLMTA